MRSFGGGLLGGLAGGMLFHSLFGGACGRGTGATGGGGIGLMDILLLAGIAYLIYWYIKKKRREADPTAGYYQSSGNVEMPPRPQYPPVYDQSQAAAPGGDQDLERGLANIRQFDPSFDEAKFQELCMDTFFKIQGAWANRDMTTVRTLFTEEMFGIFQGDAEALKAQKKINRLENIAVRSVDITEAWQESGADFITARVFANLLDYNVDEITGQVVEGSKTEPVKFEEYWTFTRPVGNNPWQLSAINQAPLKAGFRFWVFRFVGKGRPGGSPRFFLRGGQGVKLPALSHPPPNPVRASGQVAASLPAYLKCTPLWDWG